MTFGECLKYLLSTLDISISRLSKAINVDSSLVNRWVHGTRIPSYNTPYIEGISEYLAKNVHNTYQDKHINDLFLNACENSGSEISIKEKIMKVLLEAQGYSIECKRREQKESIKKSTGREQSTRLPNVSIPSINVNDNITSSVNLSEEDKIIFGTENIIAAVISLLEEALSKGCNKNNTIYITCNNDMNIKEPLNNSSIQLRNTLIKAVNNGWNVHFLLRLNSNTGKTVKFINYALPLIKTGKFIPYYVTKYDSFNTGREIILIPGTGVLSCFTTSLHSEINCAFLLKNNTAIDIFKDHFNLLIETCAQPLIKNYNNENSTNYNRYLVESEESIGNRFLYKYCFSILTLPEHLYKKLLMSRRLSNDEMLIELEMYKRRLNAFQSNIQNYEYKDIYLIKAIKQLIMHHRFYFNSHKGIELVEFEIQDIIELLQNIIHLLEKYEKYNIAFIPQKNDKIMKSDDFYCLVKERQTVFIETFKPSKYTPEVQLSIDEPMLVEAFNEYLEEIWEQIAPINKDKNAVIAWLQSQINILKNSS